MLLDKRDICGVTQKKNSLTPCYSATRSRGIGCLAQPLKVVTKPGILMSVP
jgi:hypothetical protein